MENLSKATSINKIEDVAGLGFMFVVIITLVVMAIYTQKLTTTRPLSTMKETSDVDHTSEDWLTEA